MVSTPPVYDVTFAGRAGREIDVVAGTLDVWRWRFRCGSRTISPGGSIDLFCEVPKFWMATILQTADPAREGYVSVEATAGLRFELQRVAENWKRLSWATISLPDGMQPSQEITVLFGSPLAPCHAVAHKYSYAPVTWRVDYQGGQPRYPVWPPMAVRVVPGVAAKLVLVLPSVAKRGEAILLRGRVEDANSNIGARFDGPISLKLVNTAGQVVLSCGSVRADAHGLFRVQVRAPEQAGVYRIRATAGALPPALSNAVRLEETPKSLVVWGDMHCHSAWADGSGSFDENIGYARDEAFLDVFGFAEHLGAGEFPSASAADKPGTDWAILGPQLEETVRRAHDPGRFVTLLGHEYTPVGPYSVPCGDHCLFSPSDRWRDVPMAHDVQDLFVLARNADCLVIPHVGGRIPPVDKIAFDPAVTPVIEIASMHGHFERFAQTALQAGNKFGFVGMSDGHFGMPGYDNWAQHGRTPKLAHRNYSVQSAVTAFCVPALTREEIFRAMRARRCYATTGQRILLDFSVNGVPMGAEAALKEKPRLRAAVAGTAPIALIDIIRGDRRVHRIEGKGRTDIDTDWIDESPAAGHTWYYLRVTQEDFSLAWSSPVWVTYTGPAPAGGALLPRWDDGPFWPPARPETCDPAHLKRLKDIFQRRGVADRFSDISHVGLYAEPRGRFALFHANDVTRENLPVHIHLFVDFPDDRLYIADGTQDFGATLH